MEHTLDIETVETVGVEIVKESATTLNGHILGAGLVFSLMILAMVIVLFMRHQGKSDKRWSESMENNTAAIREISDAHREIGEKIAGTINDALITAFRHDDSTD